MLAGARRHAPARLARRPRAARASRAASTMAEAMGVDTFRVKVTAFVLAALLASVSGWLFAHFQRTVNPSPFGLNMGIEYLFMAVLGGVGHVWGALVGAGVVQILEDQLQVWLPKLMGTQRQLRDHRLRRPARAGAAVRARRHLGVRRRRACRGVRRKVDWADAPAAARRAPRPPHGEVVLDVRGGAQGVRRPGRRQRRQLPGPRRRDPRPDRARTAPASRPPSTSSPACCRRRAARCALLGERIDALPSREIARLGVARTFQHVKMIAGMTVLENVALGAHLRGRHGVPAAMLRTRPRRGAPPDARGRAPAAAHRHGRAACTSWPATSRSARSA